MLESDLVTHKIHKSFDNELLNSIPGDFVYVPRYHVLHHRLIVDNDFMSVDDPTDTPDKIIHNQHVTVIAKTSKGAAQFIYVMTFYGEGGWILLMDPSPSAYFHRSEANT